MQHLPVLPVLLPLATAVLLLALGDRGGALRAARAIAIASTALALAVALRLAHDAGAGEVRVYRLGDWPPPFGIVLVIDRLSALMLVLVPLVALPVLLYAAGGWDGQGRHFHTLLQLLLAGLAGAFSTGDLFNLYVFFEVLLTASYALLVHGGGGERLRQALSYVVLNLVASALLLAGIALVYGLTGTLNLAHLALRVPLVGEPDAAILRAAAMLLLAAFAFKAALLPLHLWLPASYAAAAPPVAAVFALLTKVGAYAILRVHGVVFGADAGPSALAAAPWLLPLALAGCVAGGVGALAAPTLARLVGWLNIVSMGTILAGVGLFNAPGWSGAIWYMAHSSLVIAALFLVAELAGAQRGDTGGRLVPAAPLAQPALLGTLAVLALGSIVGLPPLPGFVGKVMILQGAHGAAAAWLWPALLAAALLMLVAVARAGSIVFWAVRTDLAVAPSGRSLWLVASPAALVACALAMSAGAGPLARYTDAAALQLADRAVYARAVLGEAARLEHVRPLPPWGRK
jgi:multicomponent K+:H+ antiporter subunit D